MLRNKNSAYVQATEEPLAESSASRVCGDNGKSSALCTAYATLKEFAAYKASARQATGQRHEGSANGARKLLSSPAQLA